MTMESLVEKFLLSLTIEQQNKFMELKEKNASIAIFICWFALYSWPHHAQKEFLYAMTELFQKAGASEARLFAAYKKQLQRIKNASPEERQKVLQKAGVDLLSEHYEMPLVHHHNYKEAITCSTLLGSPASFTENSANKAEKQYLGPKGLQVLNDIYSNVLANLDDFTSYHLARNGLQAHARWTDESNFHYTRIPRSRKGKGVFLVLAGSEVSKNESPSCVNFKRIQELRQELIQSEFLRDDGNVYTFTSDYHFSSPSLAASVLAGANLNGLRYWKDEYGRSLAQIHKGKFKIKRGPGRPRKSSSASD